MFFLNLRRSQEQENFTHGLMDTKFLQGKYYLYTPEEVKLE